MGIDDEGIEILTAEAEGITSFVSGYCNCLLIVIPIQRYLVLKALKLVNIVCSLCPTFI